MGNCMPFLKRCRSAIFGKAEKVEVIVVIGENRLSLIAEAHEELNVARRTQHGAGVKFMCIDGCSFNLTDQGFPDAMALMGGKHREQPNDTDAGHRPEAHGTDDCSLIACDENVFLPRIFFQALESFGCPATDGVDTDIFAEGGLLHREDRWKICFSRWSNVHHGIAFG